MRPIVVLVILSFITWMSSVHAMHGPVSGCCPLLSNTRVDVKKIKNYTIQIEGVCPVTAIVFLTVSGNRICSNPQSNWAKKAKVKVDEEKRLLEMERNTQASTSDFASTVPSTTKTATVKVDEEAKGLREMEQNTQASTSDFASTVPSTTKKVTVKVNEEAKGLREMEQNTQASTSDFASTVPSTTTKKVTVKVDEEAKGLREMEQNTQASTSDPQSDWAQKVTVKVDEEAKGFFLKMVQNTQASTSDLASTVPTTTKAPVKLGRKRRRRRRRRRLWRLRSRSWRKGKWRLSNLY